MSDDVTALTNQINKRKFLISALYQRSPSEWYACLRPMGMFTVFHGRGSTLLQALHAAFQYACAGSFSDAFDTLNEDGKWPEKKKVRRLRRGNPRLRKNK